MVMTPEAHGSAAEVNRTMKWFRFYSEVLHDPKVQKLPADVFKCWVNLLCAANDGKARGDLPGVNDIAFMLRITEAKAGAFVAALTAAGLIDWAPDGTLRPHNWDARQMAADSSNHRVQKYRDKIRANGETVTGYTKHRAAVLERDGNACVYCLSTAALVLDHLVPVSQGGDGEPDNLVTACRSCNAGKAGRLIEQAGYALNNARTVTQYEDVKARLGVTVTPDPVTPVTVTVTPVTVTVTQESRPRLEEMRVEGDSEGEGDSPAPPEGPSQSSPNTPAQTEDAVDRVTEMFGGLDNMPQTARLLCRDVKAAWVIEAAESMHARGKTKPVYLRSIVEDFQRQGSSDRERAVAAGSRPSARPARAPLRLTDEQKALFNKGKKS